MRWPIAAAMSIAGLAALGDSAVAAVAQDRSATTNVRLIAAGRIAQVGRVDPRFLSYNVESVEVTGGNFWAPYPRPGGLRKPGAAGPHGVEFATDAYQKREPLDLVHDLRQRMEGRKPAGYAALG